jgi:hypothetical protein
MIVCHMCDQAKPNVRVRPLLRVFDHTGARTRDPFEGLLCDYCCEKALEMGTAEHTWVLSQIIGGHQRRRIEP